MKSTVQIHIRVAKPGALFKSPPVRVDELEMLDKDIENRIIEKAQVGKKADVQIFLEFTDDEKADTRDIADRLHRHFRYREEKAKEKLRKTLNLGWRSLLIAFLFLTLIYTVVKRWAPRLTESGVTISIRELFIILGWVALWRPAELLLYEWAPLRRQVILYSRLSVSRIHVL